LAWFRIKLNSNQLSDLIRNLEYLHSTREMYSAASATCQWQRQSTVKSLAQSWLC